MDWNSVRESDAYKKGGLVERHSIRKAFFNDFIRDRGDFPKDDEGLAAKIEHSFITGYEKEEDLPEPEVKRPKLYMPKAEIPFGERAPISEEDRARAREAAMEAGEEIREMFPTTITTVSPLSAAGWAFEKTFGRGFGALKSIAAGKSPVEGFLRPQDQPEFVESVIKSKFSERMGVDPAKDPDAAMWINGLAGWALDLGSIHFIFNVGPKAIKAVSKKGIGVYTRAQGRVYDKFKSALTDEFKVAGMSDKAARQNAEMLSYKMWVRTGMSRKTPANINKSVEYLVRNKGKLGNFIKTSMAELKESAAKQGFTEEWMRKAAQVKPTLPYKPTAISKIELTKEGRKIVEEARAVIRAGKDVKGVEAYERAKEVITRLGAAKPRPITPEALKSTPALADHALSNPGAHPPEVVQAAKNIKGEVLPPKSKAVVKEPQDIGTIYNINYQTPSGMRSTIMKGDDINNINEAFSKGEVPTDSTGEPIIKVVESWAFAGRKAHLLLPDFDEAFTDLMGELEKRTSDFTHFAKKIGTPFFIGQKYPSFKPVYTSVQKAIDYKAELFFEGARILDPQTIVKLPEASHKKLADVIKLGNSPGVQRWYNPEELRVTFGLNDKEIEAYKRVQRMYRYATNMEIKSRKILMDYDKMNPDEKKIADEVIAKQVARLGGYVSQTRLEGDWAVYAPPEAEGERARFFNIYSTKSQALNAAKELGPDARVYLRRNLSRDFYRHLTVADLENLIEAAGADTSSSEIQLLRNVLKKRGFSAHWIKRQHVPGYEWTWRNILESARDYLEGAANKLSRISGRNAAEIAFKDNVGDMTPELRAYSRDFLDTFYNSGAIGFRMLNRLLYSYKLAFKVSWLAQNLTQPLATTYPELARYFKGVDVEKTFINSYNIARRYITHRLTGAPHGISTELKYLIDKLHRQGVLGDQLTRFQLGVRRLGKEEFEKWVGLFGRAGESVNRTHAAVAGYRIATQILNLTDKKAILEFCREFIYKTQFAYGKHNLPQLITGAGNVRNFIRTAYTFRHYIVSYLQLLNSQMPWRGAHMRQSMRALGILTAQAGVKGLPFYAIIALIYKKMMGRTLETDFREAMNEAGLPDKAIDITMQGAYSSLGVDTSNLVGAGDVISTIGSLPEQIGGAAVGTAVQFNRAIFALRRGEYKRALEYASPDAIRNILKGIRYAEEGLRKFSGELVNTPSKKDAILQALGFTPLEVSKAWAAREAKRTEVQFIKDLTSRYNESISKAIFRGDIKSAQKIFNKIIEYNKKAPIHRRIIVSKASLWDRIIKMHGKRRGDPRLMQLRLRRLNELFGGTNK